jgi:hypothetical protein
MRNSISANLKDSKHCIAIPQQDKHSTFTEEKDEQRKSFGWHTQRRLCFDLG